MTQNKNSKEMFVVNFKEIPETICVETRFITRAGAQQKKDQTLFYMNVNRGQVELSKYEVPTAPPQNAASIASAQLKNLTGRSKQPVVTVSIRNKPTILNKPITVTSVMSSPNVLQPPPPPQYGTLPIGGQGLTVTPMGLAMSAPYVLPDTHNFISSMPTNTNLPVPPQTTVTIPLPNPILSSMSFNPSVLMKKPVEMKDSECMTEQKALNVDRGQQTDDTTPKTSSVAIQCSLDDDFDEGHELLDNFGENVLPNQIDVEEEKEKFLQYVKENSVEYKNHFRECLICGEVCKSTKYFYGHMAVHRGPKVLCFLCGQYLDHEALLKNHNCNNIKRIASALLRCPYKRCKTVAVSRLELYDHINEHKNYRVHKCSACRKAFCTAQEFLRHLLLRAKCYTDAKRNRNRLYGLKSKADRLCRVRVFTLHTHSKRTAMVKCLLTAKTHSKNLCEICFKTFRSKYIFKRHTKKCCALFRKRSSRLAQKKRQ